VSRWLIAGSKSRLQMSKRLPHPPLVDVHKRIWKLLA
jgi:hypothetical protein